MGEVLTDAEKEALYNKCIATYSRICLVAEAESNNGLHNVPSDECGQD